MIYEFVNPSDRYTFEAANDVVATLACLLLGAGRTPWRRDDTCGPVDLFGDRSHRGWLAAHGLDLDHLGAAIEANAADIAKALESFVLGDRTAYLAGLPVDDEERAAYTAAWDDRHRSSLNRWGEAAMMQARELRRRFAAPGEDGSAP